MPLLYIPALSRDLYCNEKLGVRTRAPRGALHYKHPTHLPMLKVPRGWWNNKASIQALLRFGDSCGQGSHRTQHETRNTVAMTCLGFHTQARQRQRRISGSLPSLAPFARLAERLTFRFALDATKACLVGDLLRPGIVGMPGYFVTAMEPRETTSTPHLPSFAYERSRAPLLLLLPLLFRIPFGAWGPKQVQRRKHLTSNRQIDFPLHHHDLCRSFLYSR